ncbi:hypothetical protein KVV02_007052, partial [Mortierella alpina]
MPPYPVPLEKLRDIVYWLKPLMGPERWDEALANVERFNVPLQQDGVSCGIMATIAIEQAVNEYFSWGEVSPASARIRYLRLLTAHTKMEDDHDVMAYRAHVPDDPSIITPEENMATWLDSMVEDLDEVERRGRIKSGPKTHGWTVIQHNPPEVKYDDDWLKEPLDLSHLKQLGDRMAEKLDRISEKDGKFDRIVKGGLKKEMVDKISHNQEAEDTRIKIHALSSDSDSDASVQCAPRDPKIDDDGSSDDYSSSDEKKKRDGYHATLSKVTLKNLDLDWPSDDEDEAINITQESDMVVKEDVKDLTAPAIQDEFPDLEAAMSSIKAYARHVGFGVSTGRSHLTKRNRNAEVVCKLSGAPRPPKKEQEVNPRWRPGSKKCGCKYRIKLSSPVAISPAWHIINIVAEHNHPMDEETVRTSPLTQEMKDLIPKAVKMNFITRDIRSWLSGTARRRSAGPTQGPFWMTVEQRVLYNRYRDMVIHDTTASTNRFNMSLHCFVVIDLEFKTRIVACALTAGETTRDYELQFTTGIQPTQRVEKTHHLVKMMPVDNSATLKSVVAATVDVSVREYYRTKFTKDAEGKKMRAEKASWRSMGATKTMFRDVLDLCREVLSSHARERMIKEMDWAFMLTHSISNLGEAKQGCDASNEVEDAADLRRSSLERLLRRLDPAEVHAVYCVVDRVKRRKIEYVILLADHAYFCTCLLLQNSGLFKDEALAVDNIDKFMGKQAFFVANCHNVDLQPEQRPNVSYLEDVRRMISEESAIPKPGKIEARKKRQYGELMGVAKSAISLAQDDQDSATRLDICWTKMSLKFPGTSQWIAGY